MLGTQSGLLNNSNNGTNNLKVSITKKDEPIPLGIRMVLSGISGCGAISLCHPLDVLRVQMQTSGGTVVYRNTMDAAMKIYAQSGLMDGLYAGISASYLRQVVYGSIRIGVYSNLLERAKMNDNGTGSSLSFGTKLGIGCIAGGIGSFVGTPTEVALVRMTADSKLPADQRRNYSNVLDCLQRIIKEEGVPKLWRGAAPTVARATLLTSCQLGVTSELKGKLIESGYFGVDGQMYHGLPMLFTSSLCASFVANLVANPFDVIKSRMQYSSAYKNMFDCLVQSIKAEGPMVLYSGFTPAFVKLAPFTVICLTLAEKLTKAVTGKDAL